MRRHDDSSTTGEERNVEERLVQRGDHQIRVREYAGEEPAIILMHGLPDSLHLYDRLVPHLAGRRTIVFDFLGWGESDKPEGYNYTFANLEGDLDAVVEGLGLDSVVLVGHDASGPTAINWALDNADRVSAVVLLNIFYAPTAEINPPEVIRLFSDPTFSRLTEAITEEPDVARWLYFWQVGRFFSDDDVREEFVPLLYRQFEAAIPAFVSLNADLTATVLSNGQRAEELGLFSRPVRIVFGADDPYLNPGVARNLDNLFMDSELFLVANAGHYVQLDEPAEVARLILTTPIAQSDSP